MKKLILILIDFFLQVVYRPEVRPAGALHVDAQTGSDLQTGVRRQRAGGSNDQVRVCPRQTSQDKVHEEKLNRLERVQQILRNTLFLPRLILTIRLR